jgi:hypothetical protein
MTPPNITATWIEIIKRLNNNQQQAFSRICVGDDSMLPTATAKSLERRGLIRYFLEDGGGGLKLWRANVASLIVHQAWCEWCSKTVKEEL